MAEASAALRSQVRERAGGKCEYCLIPEVQSLVGHEIDHIVALKHGGQTAMENLALCCTICNKHKGSDLASIDPGTGELQPLFHPRQDRWLDHFDLQHGEIVPLTAAGRATVRLLRLNRPERIQERRMPG